jgi:hypothetical protein
MLGKKPDAMLERPMKYFILAINQRSIPVPIVDEHDDIQLYDSYLEALKEASTQILCQSSGYEILKWRHL